MQQTPEKSTQVLTQNKLFLGNGEMGQRIAEFPWEQTSLGPISSWPTSLVTSLSLILNSQHPMWIGWGPDLIFFYNDSYFPVLGKVKHPWALGLQASQVWAEIWEICGPLAQKVMKSGEASYVNDVQLFMNRGDFIEETFYSFSYSPIYSEGGQVAGLFCPANDVSLRVLGSRRSETLSALTENTLTSKTVKSACVSIMETLAKNPADIPFGIFYFFDKNTQTVELLATAGVSPGMESLTPLAFSLENTEQSKLCLWPLKTVLSRLESIIFSISDIIGLPSGLANQTVRECILLPMKSINEKEALGVLILGINPARQLDKEYRIFYESLGGQMARAIQHVQNYEEEKKHAEQLAEIDRAKTVFFSNVSHEFRTPLTLILSPLDDLISEIQRQNDPNSSTLLQSIVLIRRNALRLLKLVNSLLDFSRIEAHRIEAVYEATNLGDFTRDLASFFQPTIEKASLEYSVDIQDIGEPVYVDKEMWEKIIFNLLSNAFKFTLEGEIKVILKKGDGCVLLSVQDTGVGIAQIELPRLFERFHRIESSKGRSYEGTGIGLAITQELVKLHGGTIKVSSEEGKGTTFIVSVPLGYSHLPQALLRKKRESHSRTSIGSAFVEEAERWLTDEKPPPVFPQSQESDIEANKSIRILLADDNTDMRQYVSNILEKYWTVESVSNGEEAFNAIDKNPKMFDMVLSDVMMPKMDGFELINKLRGHPATQHIPIILLSAKAGEESELQALNRGANDYLLKPFSAKELLARIHTQLNLAQHREELERSVEERTRELQDAMELLRLEMQEKITKEKELVEQKTKLQISEEYQG